MAAAGHRDPAASLGPGIRTGPLSPHRQASPVPHPSVAANVDESPDVAVYLAAQVALHPLLAIDHFPDAGQIGLRELAHVGISIDTSFGDYILGLRRAYAEDLPQRDFDSLVVRNIDSRDYGHVFFPFFRRQG